MEAPEVIHFNGFLMPTKGDAVVEQGENRTGRKRACIKTSTGGPAGGETPAERPMAPLF
jgi:hypothetical protein